MSRSEELCPVCGGHEYQHHDVLWDDLISEWQLSVAETDYINRQQGTSCINCFNNLRSQALANAICIELELLRPLTRNNYSTANKPLKILEINAAGGLTNYLKSLGDHLLVEYPDYDMQALDLDTASFDLVIHSDTLEHIPNPVKGLSECRRVLVEGGMCVFTIPIVVDRFTRKRQGLKNSFHGDSKLLSTDQLVHTEFGSDFWKFIIAAGFNNFSVHVLEWPAAIAIVAKK